MGKKTGKLIKDARTAAKMTQAQLGKAVNLAASEISKAERGELELTQAALKAIAKVTGVTQASLINAEKVLSGAKQPAINPSLLTAQEKKLIRQFRSATDDQKSDVIRILNGEKTEVEQLVDALLGEKWKTKIKRK